MTDLRALTLIQPMASAIVADHSMAKDIENRPKSLPKSMLGRKTIVAVHAGLKWDAGYAKTCIEILGTEVDWERVSSIRGFIIGFMELTGRQFVTGDRVPSRNPFLLEDPWFSGPFGYEIGRAVVLPQPVKCRGMPGWWPVSPAIAADIFEQVGPSWRPS